MIFTAVRLSAGITVAVPKGRSDLSIFEILQVVVKGIFCRKIATDTCLVPLEAGRYVVVVLLWLFGLMSSSTYIPDL